MLTSNSFEHINSQHDVSAVSINKKGTAKVGEYIYRQSDQYLHEGIALNSAIKIKSGNLLKPNVNIPPQNLVLTATKNGYNYYQAKTTDGLKDGFLNTAKLAPIQNKGIKIKENGSDIQVFVIAGNIEHTYSMPKDAQWKKSTLIDLSKSANENSLKYLGLNKGELQFQEIKTENTVKKNIFSTSSKANVTNRMFSVPKDQVNITFGRNIIKIVEADASMIKYEISGVSGDQA